MISSEISRVKWMAGGRFMKQVAAEKIEVGDSIMSGKKGCYVASVVITRNKISQDNSYDIKQPFVLGPIYDCKTYFVSPIYKGYYAVFSIVLVCFWYLKLADQCLEVKTVDVGVRYVGRWQ